MRKNPSGDVRPQTIYNLLYAAELLRGRRGTGQGTRRKLSALKKSIDQRRKP